MIWSCIRSHSNCSYPGSCLLAHPSTPELELKKYLYCVSNTLSHCPNVFIFLHSHGVQADDSQLPWNDLYVEPTTLLEAVPLRLGDETPPNTEIPLGPFIRAREHDIMRHDVIVAKGGDDGDLVVVCRIIIVVLVLSKDFGEFADHELVGMYDLLLGAGYLLVVVMPCGITCPYDEVYFIGNVVLYPVEGRIDERWRGVAGRGFGAIVAGWATFSVAGCICRCARVCLVEGVWVEICDYLVRSWDFWRC